MWHRRAKWVAGTPAMITMFFVPWIAWGQEAELPQQRCMSGPEQPRKSYNLSQLLDIAQCLNPETRAAWERSRQASLAVDAVKSSYSPNVSLQAIGGFQRTPLPIPTTLLSRGYFTANTREFIPSLSAKWLLFDFGRRSGLEASARANQAAAAVAYSGAQQKLIFSVTRAYFDLRASRGRLHAADEAFTAAQTIQDATSAQRHNGRATVVAVAQAERQTALARLGQVKANGDVRTAYATLMAEVGLAASTQLNIEEGQNLPMPEPLSEPVENYVQQALHQRPDVLAAESGVHAAEGEVETARAAYRPVVSVSGNYYQNIGALSTDGSPYYSINKPGGAIFLNIELPLFDGGARATNLSIAHSKVAAAQDDLDQVRDKVAKEVVKAYNDLTSSMEEFDQAKVFLRASRTAYEASLDAYKHGVGTYTDLANDEAVLAQSESSLSSADSDVHVASVALALATGTIRVTP